MAAVTLDRNFVPDRKVAMLRQWTPRVLVVLFTANLAAYIARFGANVPFWEEWDVSYRIATKTVLHQLTLSDFFVQHNAHRIVFTNLVTALSTWLLRWNVHLEMYVSFVLAALCLTLLLSMARRAPSWVLICSAALIFSPRQDWLWSFLSQFHFALFFCLLSIWLLNRAFSLRAVLLAAISAIFATYSFGFGVLVWFICALLLLMHRAPRRCVILWAALAAFNVGLFMMFYHSAEPVSFNPADLIVFVVTMIGSPFAFNASNYVSLAQVVGVLGLVWVAINGLVLVRVRQLPILWLLLMGFAIAMCALTAIGRVPLGTRGALAYRYVRMTNLFWIAGLVFAFSAGRLRRPNKSLHLFNFAVISALALLFLFGSVMLWFQTTNDNLEGCVRDYPTSCPHLIYPEGYEQRISDEIETLKHLHLSTFAED